MKSIAVLGLAAALFAAFPSPGYAAPASRPVLARFESEAELKDWLDRMRKRLEAENRARRARLGDSALMAVPPPAAAPLAKAEAPKESESVTNVQVAGVDEGGIVKVHGEHLVVLRRGRLFTVSLREGLAPVAMADAFGPGIDPAGAWYDEMLIHGDTIIVIGFSYQRGGTEIGFFDIDRAGTLAHRATYHLRSNDYYSSRNYASRLIGDKLVFYTPLYLNLHADPLMSFPALRKWREGALSSEFRRIAPATRIYRTDEPLEPQALTLHSVTVCDLREMDCQATGVLAPSGRVFHVSKSSVYVWTSGHRNAGGRAAASVFRIPLDGGAPSAIKASGTPVDQLSFHESDDGHLNVLLRARGRGEAMWAAETGSNSMALFRVSLERFGDGRDTAPDSAYRPVPSPSGFNLQNRFVGPFLLYGAGSTWGAPNTSRSNALHVVRWGETGPIQTIALPHGVDRIEALGRHAIVIGTAAKDLHFSSVRLESDATIPHRFTRPDAAQGETRTHGFFYKPETEGTGIVGLPVVGGGRPGYRQLGEGSAAVMFLRNQELLLGDLGELAAREANRHDNCRASCVDWYGNARPLFLRNRVFALLGYEIVEGRLAEGAIREVRRAAFAPR